MTSSELQSYDAVLGCWHTRIPSVVGYHTPSAVITVVPFSIMFVAFGILFIMLPNLNTYPARFGPAIIATIGAVILSWFYINLDYPDIGYTIACIVTICAIPFSFVKKKEIQQTGSDYRATRSV